MTALVRNARYAPPTPPAKKWTFDVHCPGPLSHPRPTVPQKRPRWCCRIAVASLTWPRGDWSSAGVVASSRGDNTVWGACHPHEPPSGPRLSTPIEIAHFRRLKLHTWEGG